MHMSFLKTTVTAAALLAAALVSASLCHAEEDGYIIKLEENTASLMSIDEETRDAAAEAELEPLIPEIGLYYSEEVPQGLDCEYAEPNMRAELYDTYDYSYLQNSATPAYEFELANIYSMWDIGAYGDGVKIAVIDTGCNSYKGMEIYEAYNYVKHGSEPYDPYDCADNMGHGTRVCGMISAPYGRNVLTVGTARKAKLVSLKFADGEEDSSKITEGGTSYEMIMAINDAVSRFECDIINISSGFNETSPKGLEDAIDYAVSQGVVVVAAAGNDGDTSKCYPASYDNVISVGSVDESGTVSSFSNHNDCVFIAAPGEKVRAIHPEDYKYYRVSGTSFSSPFVCGVIASMLGIDDTLTVDEIKTIIAETSRDMGEPGRDPYYGWGIIDAGAIVDRLLEGKDYYVSPLDVCAADGLYEVRVKRNGDLPEPVGIWCAYSGGRPVDIDMHSLEFDGDIGIMRYEKPENTELKYFLWDSMSAMVPIG